MLMTLPGLALSTLSIWFGFGGRLVAKKPCALLTTSIVLRDELLLSCLSDPLFS